MLKFLAGLLGIAICVLAITGDIPFNGWTIGGIIILALVAIFG